MAQLTGKFNEGRETSSTIDRQFTVEFVTKGIVELPKRKQVFSVMSNREVMPKHMGKTISKEVDYGFLDSRNLQDGNADASTATIIQDVFYHANAAGTILVTFDSKNYLMAASHDQDTARAAAKAAAIVAVNAGAATDQLLSSSGGVVNGLTSAAATAGPLVPTPEEGGVINLVSHSSKMVSTDVSFHNIATKFSMRSIDLDSRKGLLARKIKGMGNTVADLKEMQCRGSIFSAASANAMISVGPSNIATTAVTQIDGSDVLTYDALQAFEQQQLANDVPMDTEILTGVDLTDTKTIEGGWIVFVNDQVLPTLRKMTGPGGALVWIDSSKYGANRDLIPGEKGSIGSFRFVTVKDLEREFGKGILVGDAADNGSAGQQANTYKTLKAGTTDYYYDVFTLICVGDDSFSIAGFGSNSTEAAYIPPARDVYNDTTGSMAGIDASWTYGFLNYRPERISAIKFSLQKNG